MPKLSKGYISNQGLVDNKPSTLYIGIDPGQKGGLVSFECGNVDYDHMPDTERSIWEWFDNYSNYKDYAFAVIEKVHSMPSQSSQSGFTFGMGYGGLRMALIAAGIPFEEVTPQKWQKALGVVPIKKTESKSDFKNRLLAMAQQLYPQLPIWKEPRSKGKQLAICDALLIARYCQLKCEGKL